DVETMRQFLTDSGAVGVTVLQQPAVAVSARTGATLKAGATLEASVNDFVVIQAFKHEKAVSALCQDILATVMSVS
ncbi:MAG: hypothetical protein WKG03_08915, partial [Telluria sp.]